MESTLIKHLLSFTLACLLVVVVKSTALLQYWQQTHHILLHVDEVPRLTLPEEWQKNLDEMEARTDTWMTQYQHRMLLAGQLLLMGDDVLPRIEVPIEVPVEVPIEVPVVKSAQCPEPVVTTTPVCATLTAGAEQNKKASGVIAEKTPSKTQSLANNTQSVSKSNEQNADVNDESEHEASPENTLAPVILDPTSPINLTPADKVLLIGDSLMQGVAPHVIISIKRKFGAQSVDLSRHSTGLTYPSFFNWPNTLKAALEEQQYAAVVIFLGANDPWDMNQNGHYIRFGSVKWKDIYRERVAAILQIAAEHKTRVIWLGAPPMGREDLTNKVPLLNEIYAEEIIKQPMARFIPTGPKLTSDGVTFAKFIELPERGNVIVRTDDGVHFTPQGQRILAALTLDQFASPHPKITTR